MEGGRYDILVGGVGVSAYGGDGGPALSGSLNLPSGIAFDARDNVLVRDAATIGGRGAVPAGIAPPALAIRRSELGPV